MEPALRTTWVRLYPVDLAAALHLHTHGLLSFEQYTVDHHVSTDGDVQAVAHRPEEGEGGAHADAFGIVHGDGAHPAGVGGVHVVVFGIPGRPRGLHESLLERQPVLALVAAHRDGPFVAVEVVGDVQVRFHLAEEGEDVDEGPFVVSFGGPAVVVFGDSPQQDLAVNGAGAADHLSPGCRYHLGLVGRTLGPPRPVVGSALGGRVRLVAVLEVVGIVFVVGIVRSRFQQQHR